MAEYNARFANRYKTELGVLSVDKSSRTGGKKIFDWSFIAKGSDKPTPVEVHLISDSEGGLLFRASSPGLIDAIESADIEELRVKAESALLLQVQLLTGLEWQDWYEVKVEGSTSHFENSKYSGMGSELTLQVRRLKRAVRPDGSIVTINNNGIVTRFPTEKHQDRAHPRAGMNELLQALILQDDAETARCSYIPATEQNTAALKEIIRRMGELRSRMLELMSQEQIQERLDAVQSELLQLGSSLDEPSGQPMRER